MAPPLGTETGGEADATRCKILPDLQPPVAMAPPFKTVSGGEADAVCGKILPEFSLRLFDSRLAAVTTWLLTRNS